jgi:hypothetical protein
MCHSVSRVGIAAALLLVALASTAQAEPIQVVYRINVYERCEYSGSGPQSCAAYEASFPLTLTFDSGVTIGYGDDMDRTRFYGAPTISDIPLPRRTDFPPMTETLRQAAERARFSAEDGAWIRESAVQIRYGASSGGSDYHRDFSLLANGLFAFPPDLNAESFARFLGTAPFRQFGFSDSVELASGGFELLSYRGTVTPVPEPMSLLLVGSGLGALAARRRLRARRPAYS